MKRKKIQPQEVQAKRKKPSIVRLASMPNVEAEDVLQRMREKDIPLKGNKIEVKRTANIYNLFAHLFSRLECEDYKDVKDEVIFFKADYMLDNVLLKLECADVATVQQFCCVCFILQWKYERVEEVGADYYDVAVVLKTFNESFDDVGVDELTKILIRREIEALAAVQYRVEQVTAYDFVLTFMCTTGCLYFGESDSKFKKEVKRKLEQLLKHDSNTRLMKAEKVAHLLILFVRKQYFYLPLDPCNEIEEFYKTIKV